MIESNIRNYTGIDKSILITSSDATTNYTSIAEKIKELLGHEFNCTISFDILLNVEARQAMAACDEVV